MFQLSFLNTNNMFSDLFHTRRTQGKRRRSAHIVDRSLPAMELWGFTSAAIQVSRPSITGHLDNFNYIVLIVWLNSSTVIERHIKRCKINTNPVYQIHTRPVCSPRAQSGNSIPEWMFIKLPLTGEPHIPVCFLTNRLVQRPGTVTHTPSTPYSLPPFLSVSLHLLVCLALVFLPLRDSLPYLSFLLSPYPPTLPVFEIESSLQSIHLVFMPQIHQLKSSQTK